MNEAEFIQIAEARFDEIAGPEYHKSVIGAIQFGNYLASLSRGSCVSIFKTPAGIETHVCGESVDSVRFDFLSCAEN